jgi:4-hydroxy-3-methylbut-2-enyl diphosphate reductase
VSDLLIAVPLRLEALLVRSAARGARVHRTGMGSRHARAAAHALLKEPGDALLVLGFCGGLDDNSEPGEVVVADEVFAADGERAPGETILCSEAASLASLLTRRGLTVRRGPVVCVSRPAFGKRRRQLRESGVAAIAVDMESAWLAPGAGGRPFGVVRVVVDSPTHELLRPQAAAGAFHAARALRRAAAALHDWTPQPGLGTRVE